MRAASWVTFIAGLWLIAAPFVLRYNGTMPITEDVIFGILIASFSFWSASTLESGSGPSVLVILFGIWVIIAPWVLLYASTLPVARQNDVITGIVTVVFGLISAYGIRRPVARS